jgi:hypothetical protein
MLSMYNGIKQSYLSIRTSCMHSNDLVHNVLLDVILHTKTGVAESFRFVFQRASIIDLNAIH